MEKFPSDIYLKNTWIVWELEKFKEGLRNYRKELNKLKDMSCSHGLPVAVESFTMDYYKDSDPEYLAKFWSEVDTFIKKSESEDWVFSNIEMSEVNVSTYPWDEYEMLTPCYTVYASIKNEDITQTLEYKQQEKLVQHYLDEVLHFKNRIDEKI